METKVQQHWERMIHKPDIPKIKGVIMSDDYGLDFEVLYVDNEGKTSTRKER